MASLAEVLRRCGPAYRVLGPDGQWQARIRKSNFLFLGRALSRVFRGHFMAALKALALSDPALADANLSPEGRKTKYRHDRVVYAKTPLGGPAQVPRGRCRHPGERQAPRFLAVGCRAAPAAARARQ